ncbi:hypothetical protein JMM81_07480 [Bacillus sp. V3B]|uniref:hypothetical protein n=1 Tax=Bacillus sp. V3B TaxID=2804915 RepID=UPI00210B580B|nr:hypothetical protein [Bacillus sp. V3B]MCQ6274810.1 hypothetical protein [Bacillus sp. V3B]
MSKTELPTKNDYENAINELKKLNEELFYDDFKTKMKNLENHLEHLAFSTSNDFKNEAENIISRASALFRQIETQQEEMSALLENYQSASIQKNEEFLEYERTQLLFVYEELQQSIHLFTEQTVKLQQDIENNNKYLVEQAVEAVSSVSDHITEFVQKLSLSDEKNKEFLEQNRAYVTLAKTQMTETEQKITANAAKLQQIDERWEQLLKSYEAKLQIHEQGLKNILVVREEALINKVIHQHDNWIIKQFDNDEAHKAEILEWHEKVATLLKVQSKQNQEMLESISTNLSSKNDLKSVEKKNAFKTNILLAVVVIEAILIGVQFFI